MNRQDAKRAKGRGGFQVSSGQFQVKRKRLKRGGAENAEVYAKNEILTC